jgi:phosphohistidine phosphatase
MQLILLRHGKAEDSSLDGDFSRTLTRKGHEQSRRAGRLLKAAGCLPDIVLTSPLIRARQTAEEFCAAAEIPGAIIQGWLTSGFNSETGLSELAGFQRFKRVMIVGHEPDFSSLIEFILEAPGGSIQMKKGAIACLQVAPPSRQGTLLYLIPPKLADEPEESEVLGSDLRNFQHRRIDELAEF